MLCPCRCVVSSRVATSCQPLFACTRDRVRCTLKAALWGHDSQHVPTSGTVSQRVPVPSSTRTQASARFSSTRSDARPRVCVVGGGFGGLYAAIRLESLLWPQGTRPQVTLVDMNERFVFKPLLYELLNGASDEQEVAPLFTEVLAPYPIQFIQAKVTSIEPNSPSAGSPGGVVCLSDGGEVGYDYLVVALGAASDSRGVPGVNEYAVPFVTYEDAMKVKAVLDAIAVGPSSSEATVAIVGAGYTGVELATVVAERLDGRAAIKLVTPGPDILVGAPEGQREAARKALQASGVAILTGTRVKALVSAPAASSASGRTAGGTAVPPCTVQLEAVQSSGAAPGDVVVPGGSSSLTADLVVWTAGSAPCTPGGRKGMPFPTNQRGSIRTERTLQVTDHPNVFAVGDVSETGVPSSSSSFPAPGAPAAPFPHTAQVAFQQADYVAWNIWAAINKRPLLPFRYQHLGSMMSLGQLNGAVALPIPVPPPIKSLVQDSPLAPLLNLAGVSLSPNDPDNGVTLEGPLAALARRAAYLYRQPTNEQRVNVVASWLQQAARLAGGGTDGGGRSR